MKTKIICSALVATLLVLSACGSPAAESEDAMNVPDGGIAEIVEFYNRHVNEVKAAEQVTIQLHDVRDMDIEVPALLRSRMPDDANDLMNRNETIAETFISGRGTDDASRHINDFLPVTGTPYVSKLQASHVQNATRERQGYGWVVTINLNNEPLDTELIMAVMNMNPEDMTKADRERMMNELLANSGYAASMNLGFGGEMPQREAPNQGLPGFLNPDSVNMEGALRCLTASTG